MWQDVEMASGGTRQETWALAFTEAEIMVERLGARRSGTRRRRVVWNFQGVQRFTVKLFPKALFM